jgi:periplasmic divalent cation tolerance protein
VKGDLCLVYVTAADEAEAMKIGRAVVEARLAACANVLAPMKSTYWWEGSLQDGEEAVLILKTRASLVDRLTQEVRKLHSYSLPAIVALPLAGGDEGYLDWLLAETLA